MNNIERRNFIPALRFSWLTPAYDVVVRLTTRESTFKRAMIAQTDARLTDRVLDLGCGTGTLAIALGSRVAKAFGVDADPRVLERARAKAARAGVPVQFDSGFADSVPHADESFDLVVTSLFLHHLRWDGKLAALREALRVLRPGGRLHVADWGEPDNLLMRAAFFPVQWLDGVENTRDNVLGRLPEAFRSAGFIHEEQTRTFSTVFGTVALYRAVKPG